MTMNYERRNAVNRTRELLVDILQEKYDHTDIWNEARRCLKHFPSDYDMEQAAEQAPEIFGDWEYYKQREAGNESNPQRTTNS